MAFGGAKLRPPTVRYGVAILLCGAALLFNLIRPHPTGDTQFFLFSAAVLASALYGDIGPGLVATALCALASSYFFLAPLGHFHIEDPKNVERLALFVVEGGLISVVGHAIRRSPPPELRSTAARYAAPVALVAAAAGLKLIAFPSLERQVPFTFFYAAVTASAWIGGIGPGLVATVLSAVCAQDVFLLRLASGGVFDPRVTFFGLDGVLVCLLTAGYRESFLKTQATLRHVFESSPLGILIAGRDLRVLSANPAAGRLFQRQSDTLEGAAIADFVHPASRERVLSALNRLLARDSPAVSVGQVVFLRDGEPLWTDLHASLLEIRDNGDARCLLMIDDISERRSAEEALRESEARLEQAQKVEAIGLLAGGIAHDFNNLLTVILGYSEELLTPDEHVQSVRNAAEEISGAARRAADLARQLLAFSRKRAHHVEAVDVNSVVADMSHFLRRLMGEHIELAIALHSTLGRVYADPGQIEQILMNLAANARDAMRCGGRLTIETIDAEVTNQAAGVHGVVPPGHYIGLAVADTGEGMDSATLARIFEPFFTTKHRKEGTGLGLATIARVVKQLGGYIAVESAPGQGTRFTIYLPTLKTAVSTQAAPAVDQRNLPRAETVLVVEDQDSLRNLMATVLRRSGHRVLEARDGNEALSVAAEHAGNVQLVVTDVFLPGIQGPALTARLLEGDPTMKMLFISGDPSGANLGPDQPFLAKPFTPEVLVQRVREILDQPKTDAGGRRAGL